MIEDGKIIELFFRRSEQAIRELDEKYGNVCRKLSHNIVHNRQDAEECVNDAYLGAWNAIPPVEPSPLLTYICKIVRNISLKTYWRKAASKRSSTYTTAMEEIEACISTIFAALLTVSALRGRIGRNVYSEQNNAVVQSGEPATGQPATLTNGVKHILY